MVFIITCLVFISSVMKIEFLFSYGEFALVTGFDLKSSLPTLWVLLTLFLYQ